MFLPCSWSLIPHPQDGPDHSRSRYETREEIRHDYPFYLELIFQLPGKGGREASLSGKCDLSANCCSVVANVAIGAARLTINADLSASSTVRL